MNVHVALLLLALASFTSARPTYHQAADLAEDLAALKTERAGKQSKDASMVQTLKNVFLHELLRERLAGIEQEATPSPPTNETPSTPPATTTSSPDTTTQMPETTTTMIPAITKPKQDPLKGILKLILKYLKKLFNPPEPTTPPLLFEEPNFDFLDELFQPKHPPRSRFDFGGLFGGYKED